MIDLRIEGMKKSTAKRNQRSGNEMGPLKREREMKKGTKNILHDEADPNEDKTPNKSDSVNIVC